MNIFVFKIYDMIKTGIYKISSLIDGRIYIGSSKDIMGRIRVHKCLLKQNKHHSIKLQRFYNKYKLNSLKFEIIKECKLENLIQIEQYYIDKYKPYFNCTSIANRVEQSQEFKDKLIERNKNMIWTDEMKDKSRENRECNLILDTETGIFYYSTYETIKYNNIKYSTSHFQKMLKGTRNNKTKFILV